MERTLPGVENEVFVLGRSRQIGGVQFSDQATNRFSRRRFFSSELRDDQWSEETTVKDFKSLMMLFCKKSSIYALNQVGNSKTAKRRVFWLLILLVGSVGSVVQITSFFKAYYAYPVVLNVYTRQHQRQQFPAVTFCNQNRLRREFEPCLKRGIRHADCNESVADVELDSVLTVDASCPWLGINSFIRPFNIVNVFQVTREKLYIELDDESKRRYGHQKHSFIRLCKFRSGECRFKHFLNQKYGNCFTFNAANDETPVKTSVTPEPHEGLALELDLEADSYLDSTRIVGARVQIHDPHQEPDVSSLGFDISPGFQTSISLARSEIWRLPDPYESHCQDSLPNATQRSCQMHCKFKSRLERCGCSIERTKGVRACDLTKVSDMCCIKETDDTTDCACPLPCKEVVYKTSSFTAVYPSRAYYSTPSFLHFRISYSDYEKFRENFARLVIFFETAETTVFEQKALFDSSEIFSQIGGQIGLWLGMSVVAIFECVEIFAFCLKYKRSDGSEISFVS